MHHSNFCLCDYVCLFSLCSSDASHFVCRAHLFKYDHILTSDICKDPISKQDHIRRFQVDKNFGWTLFNSVESICCPPQNTHSSHKQNTFTLPQLLPKSKVSKIYQLKKFQILSLKLSKSDID